MKLLFWIIYFLYAVAIGIVNDDYEPQSIYQCKEHNNWPKQKYAIKGN